MQEKTTVHGYSLSIRERPHQKLFGFFWIVKLMDMCLGAYGNHLPAYRQ